MSKSWLEEYAPSIADRVREALAMDPELLRQLELSLENHHVCQSVACVEHETAAGVATRSNILNVLRPLLETEGEAIPTQSLLDAVAKISMISRHSLTTSRDDFLNAADQRMRAERLTDLRIRFTAARKYQGATAKPEDSEKDRSTSRWVFAMSKLGHGDFLLVPDGRFQMVFSITGSDELSLDARIDEQKHGPGYLTVSAETAEVFVFYVLGEWSLRDLMRKSSAFPF